MAIEKYTFYGKVTTEGKLVLDNQAAVLKDLKAFCNKKVELTVERLAKKKTVRQLRFFFGFIVQPIYYRLLEYGFENNGKPFTKEDTYNWICQNFLKTDVLDPRTGEITHSFMTASRLTTLEMSELWATLQQFASEQLELILPDPIDLSE